jgi:hypothetical protein
MTPDIRSYNHGSSARPRSHENSINTGRLRFIRAASELGIRKTTLHESFIKTGRLRFVKISARAVGVIEDELEVLIEELRRERDGSPHSPRGSDGKRLHEKAEKEATDKGAA